MTRGSIDMRRVIAVIALALVAGCDALWGLDYIDPPSGTSDAARPHTGPFMHFAMDLIHIDYTVDSVNSYRAACMPDCPLPVVGHLNGALEFNAGGQIEQRLQITTIDELKVVDQFSVAGWVQLTTLAGEACPWSKPYSTGAGDTWQLCINPSGAISFITYGQGGGNQISTAQGFAGLDGAFHHAAIVYDGASKTLYWDGEVVATGEAAMPLVDDDDVVIGNDRDGTAYVAPLDGALDELAFFAYALTPGEVAALAAQ